MWIPTKRVQEEWREKRVGRTSLDLLLQALTMNHGWAAVRGVCVCVGVLCFRSEDVDKLSDPGRQHPEPRSVFDFEPGKSSASQLHSQVSGHEHVCMSALLFDL